MKIRALLSILFAILFVSGCASAPEGSGATEDVVVQVEGMSAGLGGVTVHLVSPIGGREFIGTLPADGTALFDVRGPVVAGEYRLVAQAPNGRTIASRPFLLREPGVRWNITNNSIFPLG